MMRQVLQNRQEAMPQEYCRYLTNFKLNSQQVFEIKSIYWYIPGNLSVGIQLTGLSAEY